MYRLQVKVGKEWRWGLHDYPTEEAATDRMAELEKVGIKSRLRKSAELFN